MSTVPVHDCRPLHVAGVLRCTRDVHWWQPVTGTATQPQPATR